MNDQEIDLLDELYFVQSYKEVKTALDWEDAQLQKYLFSLNQKEYIKMLINQDEEYDGIKDFDKIPWEDLYFLATKKGLLEHNGF
ncbi:hypothetical protein MATR_17450 [Marivirga tractuosa]|uniref:Uncharacterized protein n=1 Tax=Marivirga tractuosa (strain ATCC 23168 / DSM 4126 / NBRC 15989 / NCIMB 1408 / VKM B-1430 / H-43) TaxID=643867 RepID=E4TQR9_MARTH|nr:hypothetical protein [Marivirga tractuosa]ADR20630.1 hypothetical protein Ftrac_0628 [Marivirga tractuosa DSM 4126]BDD14920.1 hypothetical protein MATR_17450 [Marivirga tractuosa]